MTIANDIIVTMSKISEIFPGVNALENMDSSLKRSEIQPLLGENGVGFIQTLAGDL
jgi:simple sugar transport system ATP-binding protein